MASDKIPRKDFNEIQYYRDIEGDNEVRKDIERTSGQPDEWEKYRETHEPVEHWELRKEFIKQNAGKFAENRLLCLSKTFANMEFLGCKYPLDTMELVQECSLGVVEEYRKAKQGRLQRTFVKASDAAEAKTKGQNRPSGKKGIDSPSSNSSNSHAGKTSGSSKNDSHLPYISPNNVALQCLLKLDLGQMNLGDNSKQTDICGDSTSVKMSIEAAKKIYPCAEDIDVALKKSFDAIKLLSSSKVDVLNNVDKTHCKIINAAELMKDLSALHIMELDTSANEITILTHSFSACHKTNVIRFDLPPLKLGQGVLAKCDVCIGSNNRTHIVIQGEGKSQKDAKKDAAAKTLAFLRQIRPTIKVKDAPTRKVERSEIVPSNNSKPAVTKEKVNIDMNSKAMKMMLAMGWKGGGLGPDQSGISTAIPDPVAHNTRLGLGNVRNNSLKFEEKLEELLREEQESLYESDIEFASSFTKGERKIIHNLAEKMGFKSKSYGHEDNRYLIISRKVEPEQIFREVMAAGGETLKYKVELPAYLSK